MLLICYGTRPEYIKVKPLIDGFEGIIPFKTLFTGQHLDLVKSRPDYVLEMQEGRNRLDSIVSSIMNGIDFHKEGITSVLVQGDTTSSFAIALSAFQHNIRVVHLEAGLRTYNLDHPYPEEANRQMISRIASIHLCPTDYSKNILEKEKISGIVEVVGNTVLDNLVNVKVGNENKVLVTLHRRENQHNIEAWFREIEKLSKKYNNYDFVIPVHPNPKIKKYKNIFKNVIACEPMSYSDLIDFLSSCSYVITDSGGIQEEAAFFKKPCMVCRRETERTEGLGNYSLLCEEPDFLFKRFEELNALELKGECPYGDGKSVEKIIKILKEFL